MQWIAPLFLFFLFLNNTDAVGRTKNIGVINDIRYTPGTNTNSIVIDYSGPAVLNIVRRPELKQVIVDISGVSFPGSLARKIDTSAIPGPVTEITPYNTGAKIIGSKVVVQLRSDSQITEEKGPGEYRLIFSNSAASRRNKEVAISPWGRRPGQKTERDSVRIKSAAPDRALEAAEELIKTLSTPQESRVYKGTRVSIESDNVDVHDIFRLVGSASGLNILTTTEVSGVVSLSLTDVPWDQLLDIVLQERQLKAVNNGNIIRITTVANFNKEQEAKLALQVVEEKIEPVLMAIIPVNYAKAEEIKTAISSLLVGAIDTEAGLSSSATTTSSAVVSGAPAALGSAGGGGAPGGTGKATTIEEAVQAFVRGKIQIDERTNSLLVTHTAEQIKRIRALVKELDVPTPQVLIESKIIQAQDNFARTVGIDWGGFFQNAPPGGTNENAGGAGFAINGFDSTGAFSVVNPTSGSGSGLFKMRLGAGTASKLDLQISLAEVNSQAKIMASPRVIVNNNKSANITDGTKIAYTTTTSTSTGANVSTQFVDANLSLSVSPQVTNSGQVLMDLTVTQAAPTSTAGGVPNISSKSINTNVLVESGSTLVLGGVYTYTLNKNDSGLPWLKDLPILGALFRKENTSQARSELLVFVTPRVIEASAVEESNLGDEGVSL
jgi:type IV pilus assembly protein PilQ